MPEGNYYVPQPIQKDRAGGVDKGPRDIMRDLVNPDMLVPPTTGAGLVPNLKFSFSDTYMRSTRASLASTSRMVVYASWSCTYYCGGSKWA